MTGRKMMRTRPGPLRAVLGMVVGLSVIGSLGMLSDRSKSAAQGPRQVGPPLTVPVTGSGVVEQELDGPDDAGGPAREAVGADTGADDPAAHENRVPRFLGTFQLSGETRAIFEVQGARKPWMGKAGERIEGTEFLLEAFDGTSARIVPASNNK